MRILTIGYEGSSLNEFISSLTLWGVELLVDVREMPLSRKKGFSKTSLRENLQLNGIRYYHSKVVGCPKPIRKSYKEDRNWQKYTSAYLRYLDAQGDEVVNLYELCQEQLVCLLCFEANPLRCHRTYVADQISRLSPSSADILHINPITKEVAVPQLMERAALPQPASFQAASACFQLSDASLY